MPPKAALDTVAPVLYKDNRLEITEREHIQYPASIRNKCVLFARLNTLIA